jgi:hypothetical protein
VVARLGRNLDLAVNQRGNLNRTGILNLAVLAAFAFGKINLRYTLADDAKVVEIRLYTVVRTAAYRDLEFVRQGYVMVTGVEKIMQFLGEGEGVDQTILAGSAFTGNYRTNL